MKDAHGVLPNLLSPLVLLPRRHRWRVQFRRTSRALSGLHGVLVVSVKSSMDVLFNFNLLFQLRLSSCAVEAVEVR